MASEVEKLKTRNRYRDDPVAYGREVRGVTFTRKQEKILAAIQRPPHRVMVKSANGVGKSWLAAFICVWFYETRDPSNTILTAPTYDQVSDVTFKEIRRLMAGSPDLLPKNPRCQDHVGHLMKGLTAGSATAFQGRRENSNLIVFEECMGIGPEFWVAARYMLTGGSEGYWLSILNPTDRTGHAYTEELSGAWEVISISAFEHPNIIAELQGLPPPIPAAVRLGQLKDNMESEGSWITAEEFGVLDIDLWDYRTYEIEEFEFTEEMAEGVRFHFPLRYWRPSPIGEARIIGRYPSQSAYAVFSEAAFDRAEKLRSRNQHADPIILGCDVARFGDDDTTIHVRRGISSLEHHSFHGINTTATSDKLKEICKRLGKHFKQEPRRILINIDDSGVGGGVVDQMWEDDPDHPGYRLYYNAVGVNNGCSAVEPDKYPNIRSEILFNLAEKMNDNRVDLSLLSPTDARLLRHEALGIIYWNDARGRRVVELKADIKKRLGHSPDNLDAFALCHYAAQPGQITGSHSKPAEEVATPRPSVNAPRFGPLAGSGGRNGR